MLRLAKEIDRIAVKYDVDIIVTPQYTDIRLLAENTERILVFAQHMDCLPVGRGLGSVLPEAVKAAGAKGVMLNHAEKPLDRETLAKTIARADEVGLGTIVCADTLGEIAAVYNVIHAGALATGSTSGIMKAADPAAMTEEMISALRRAWDELHT